MENHKNRSPLLQGIHYRNPAFYHLQTFVKLGWSYNERYKMAAKYIKEGEHVLDVCAGPGDFKEFLPQACTYEAIDGSREFIKLLTEKKIRNHCLNLHEPLDPRKFKSDAVVMLISLCHFGETSVHPLLDSFKHIAKKVIIVEEVLPKKRNPRSIIQRTMNFFCRTPYSQSFDLLTESEFSRLMEEHGYQWKKYNNRYCVGYYGV